MATASELFDRAKNAGDLQGLLKQGIGGSILAVFFGITSGILSVADLIIKPVDAIASSTSNVIRTIFDVSDIIAAGITATADSILGSFNLGPFSFALSIGAVLLGFYIISRYLELGQTTNIGLFGTGIDVPTPGFTDAEEDEDE